MKLERMKVRTCDAHGCGHFGASRGKRDHNGVDLVAAMKEKIQSPVRGVVTKVGYPYADDLSWRYVEVTAKGYRFRFFYVSPWVGVGDKVNVGTVLGRAQGIENRYIGITPHIHFEIKGPGGGYIDPTPVLIALGGGLPDDTTTEQ